MYKTVVSEFMLQQTQVKTVLPYFAKWLARFPDFAALAGAPEADVLKHWEGLGYYSRARNLHRLAQAVAAMTAPPVTPEQWQALPGVGPYTAAAIASIGCGTPVACVDGNVARVLARLTADATAFASGSELAKHFRPLAGEILAAEAPGAWNEAMMELGATVCLPRAPLCTVCPLVAFCAGARNGDADTLPRLGRPKTEQRRVVRAWCVARGAVLLHRAPSDSKRLADLHELPTAADLGLEESLVARGDLLLRKSRSITRYRIEESIHRLPAALLADLPAPEKQNSAAEAALHWIPIAEIERITLSGPHRRWLGELLAGESAP